MSQNRLVVTRLGVLRDERDRARHWAVNLEQENAALIVALGEAHAELAALRVSA